MKHKCVIFLTACVNPGGMANTLHTDCRQRMEEYKEALCFYLQKTKLPIVFTIRSSISTTPVLRINCAISMENVVKTDKPIALYMQNVF